MQRRNLRTKPRQTARRHNPRRWAAMNKNAYHGPVFRRENPLPQSVNGSSQATGDSALEFGRFQMLLRRRQRLIQQNQPGILHNQSCEKDTLELTAG